MDDEPSDEAMALHDWLLTSKYHQAVGHLGADGCQAIVDFLTAEEWRE